MREAIIGVSVSATNAENKIAAATVKPNSRNMRPTLPGRKEMGRNTAVSVAVVAMTAKAISRLPSSAASIIGWPSSRRRKMFSNTTMASSTTRPMAKTMPSRVSTLMEKPNAYITVKAAMMDTGMVMAGMSVARHWPRNR